MARPPLGRKLSSLPASSIVLLGAKSSAVTWVPSQCRRRYSWSFPRKKFTSNALMFSIIGVSFSPVFVR